jgi:hypothetical protein
MENMINEEKVKETLFLSWIKQTLSTLDRIEINLFVMK